MVFASVLSHILIGVAIAIMGAAIAKANKLMDILEGSNAEGMWNKTRFSFILLTSLYIVIMITRILGEQINLGPISEYDFHGIIMNLTFLLTSILFFNLVTLDIKAFKSLFELLEEDPIE